MTDQIQISDLIERLKYLQKKTGDIFMPAIFTSEGIMCYIDFRLAQPDIFDYVSNIKAVEERDGEEG